MNLKEEIKTRLEKTKPTRVFSYIHGDGRIGVLLEIESDTDFCLRTDKLTDFAHQVLLQIASMEPVSVCVKTMEPNVFYDLTSGISVDKSKPEHIQEKILEGKMLSMRKEYCLIDQTWIKDNSKTIGSLLDELKSELKEGIKIVRFSRFGQ